MGSPRDEKESRKGYIRAILLSSNCIYSSLQMFETRRDSLNLTKLIFWPLYKLYLDFDKINLYNTI